MLAYPIFKGFFTLVSLKVVFVNFVLNE